MQVLNSTVPLFCIKMREYKIAITNFLLELPIVQNCLKYKSKILKSIRVAFRDFTQKFTCFIELEIYSIFIDATCFYDDEFSFMMMKCSILIVLITGQDSSCESHY